MRLGLLAITLVFIVLLGAVTVDDFVKHGVTGIGVIAVLILALFAVGIVGALRQPPRQ